jgi:hypothetical protein
VVSSTDFYDRFTTPTMKNAVFRDIMLCGSCKNRRFGERIACVLQLLVTGNIVPVKRRFLQEPHGVTFHKTFFIV